MDIYGGGKTRADEMSAADGGEQLAGRLIR